jgi:hypothetical protein
MATTFNKILQNVTSVLIHTQNMFVMPCSAIIKLFFKKNYLFEMLKNLRKLQCMEKFIKIGLPILQV